MRRKGYDVIDDPPLPPSDDRSMVTNYDHCIDGVGYDSCSPMLAFGSGSEARHLKFDALERSGQAIGPIEGQASMSHRSEFFEEHEYPALMKLCAKFVAKRVESKVCSGQTRNLLLNLSDLPIANLANQGSVDYKSFCNSHLVEVLSTIPNLDSAVAIFPLENAPHRGIVSGGDGEEWAVHLIDDMEGLEWKKGWSNFEQLKSRANIEADSAEDETDYGGDGRDVLEKEEGVRRTGGPRVATPTKYAGIIAGLLGMLSMVFGGGSRHQHFRTDGDKIETTARMYGRDVERLLASDSPDAEDTIKQLKERAREYLRKNTSILPAELNNATEEISHILEETVLMATAQKQILSSTSVFLMGLQSFFFILSRGLYNFLQKHLETSLTVTVLPALVITVYILQSVLDWLFLGIFFNSFLYLAMAAGVLALYLSILGRRRRIPSLLQVAAAADYISEIVWDGTDIEYLVRSKTLLPPSRNIAVILLLLLGSQILYTLFSIFHFCSGPWAAIIYGRFAILVSIFKWLAHLKLVLSFILPLLLSALVVETLRSFRNKRLLFFSNFIDPIGVMVWKVLF